MEYQEIKGERVPALGLGTWRLSGGACERAVEAALSMGYRHIDTARMYRNEEEVGRGIKASGVSREEVFLVTKLQSQDLSRDKALAAGRDSARRLGADYIDLLLIHWPSRSVPVGESLEAMRRLQDEGLVRRLGVSNFSAEEVEEAQEHAEVFCNQVRYSPHNDREDLRSQARELDYLLTAYTPTGKGRVAEDPVIREIAASHGKTPTQVALRWLVRQEKVAAIPKATSDEHLRENLDLFDFELTEEETERVSTLSR